MGLASAVLVVDDEDHVRRFIRIVLQRDGYTVLEAGSGIEALSLFRVDPRQVDLVITDLTMPGMGGLDLATELLRERPDLPLLYMTGYNDSIAVDSIISQDPRSMLTKPFVANDLLARVRDLLSQTTSRPRN